MNEKRKKLEPLLTGELYCSSLRSNVHAKAQRESQVLAGRASVSQKGIFHHFKTVGDKTRSSCTKVLRT